MKTEVKVTGLDGVLNTLRSLPPELVSKRGGPVKQALAKGARLLLEEAKSNLKRAVAADGDESTGLLLQNVVATRGKTPFGSKGEKYLIRVRRKIYPDSDGKAIDVKKLDKAAKKELRNTRKTAHLLEYGSKKQQATPWLRPAVRTKGPEVIQVVRDELLRRLDQAVKKLAKMNGGR